MTDNTDGRRGLLVMLAVFVTVTVIAVAFTPDQRLSTAVLLSIGFAVVIAIVMAIWRFCPSWFITPSGPLQDLDPDERRIVTSAVRSGEVIGDPRLAAVAASHAGRTARSARFMVGLASVNIAVRIWLLARDDSIAARVDGAVWLAIWVAYLGYSTHRLSRSRRAEMVNR